MDPIKPMFFERDPVICARDLIGATFVWRGCAGRIVETEAYAADGDPACHTCFRPSARKFMAEHPAGTAYVYLNYGIHWLFNVQVKGRRGAGFVLFRALEPLGGVEGMMTRRGRSRLRDLCSGPGKLTRALGIDGSSHGSCFLESGTSGLSAGPAGKIIAGPRVGISRGVDSPWRFFEADNAYVSGQRVDW